MKKTYPVNAQDSKFTSINHDGSIYHHVKDNVDRDRMRCQPLTILRNICLALAVFAQAGCGGTIPTAQEQMPGGGTAVSAMQAPPSPTMIPATRTATIPPTPTQATATPTRTPTTSPTSTTSPTPTPDWQPYSGILTSAKQETVSSSSVDPQTPVDILPKFTLNRFFTAKQCLKHEGSSPGPVYETSEMPQKAKQMDAPLLLSCGWPVNEIVKVTVRYPDGRENSKNLMVASGWLNAWDEIFFASNFYQITLDDPAGVYTFITDSGRARLETQLNVEKTYYTLNPRVFPVFDDPFSANYHLLHQNRVMLYGFAPNESVRLLLYNSQRGEKTYDIYYYYSFIGSQQVETGPDGNLVIKNELPDASYWVAIGETSGVVFESFYNETGSLRPPTELPTQSRYGITVQCPVILPTRLNDNHQYIRVAKIDTESKKVRIRKEPGFDKEILGEIPEGTELNTEIAPQCAGGTWWWLVSPPPPIPVKGWVAEADPKEYILEPIP